jgi:hypothetical protein
MRFKKIRTKLAEWLVGEDTKRNEVKIVHHHSESILLKSQQKINTKGIPEQYVDNIMRSSREEMMLGIIQECLDNDLFKISQQEDIYDNYTTCIFTELRVIKPLKQ